MSDTTASTPSIPSADSTGDHAVNSAPTAAVPSPTSGAAASSVSPSKTRAGAAPKMFGIDARFVPPIFITLILLLGQVAYGVLESWPKLLTAIGGAMIIELVLGRLFTGKWPMLASAYISGISVGILIRSPFLWPYLLCSAISITSKYVIRWRGRHLWNPSNFGISMMLLIVPAAVTTLTIQWGNSLWSLAVIWFIGSIIISRLKRFHITLTYVASFILFALVRGIITRGQGQDMWHAWMTEVAPITGSMYQLFIFFMITDPKSTVMTKKAQMLVAFLIAAMECVLRLLHHFIGTPGANELSIHAPYYALFIVGPIANAIEIARSPLKPKPVAGV